MGGGGWEEVSVRRWVGGGGWEEVGVRRWEEVGVRSKEFSWSCCRTFGGHVKVSYNRDVNSIIVKL